MATGWASPTKENLNFARLCRLLIDGGTHVLRHVFDTIHSPSTLHTVLHSAMNHTLLKGLRAKRVVTVHQWDKLYPKTTSTTPVTSGGFDITLLFVLLRNICNLSPPPTGWDKPPAASDLSKEADLARIKLYRNELYGHITQTAVSDADFENLWTEISAVLIRLGGPHNKSNFEKLKVREMDLEEEKYLIKTLEEWEETERSIKTAIKESEQRVMGKLEDMEGKLGKEKTIKDSEQRVMEKLEDIEGKLGKEKTIKDSEQRVMEKLEDMEGKLGQEKTIKESEQQLMMEKLEDMEGKLGAAVTYNITIKDNAKAVVGDNAQFTNVESPASHPAVEKDDLSLRAQDYTRKLKLSITRQTESLPVLEGQTAISIDDVFTNVTIQRVKKDQEQSKSGREQFDVFQASSTTLKKCSEMFIWPENDDPNCRSPITANPKFILLTGKPGIGKSEFCRKMSRDWAKDGILDFKFLFLLTYRQLSLLDHEELDLCDILNRSSLLDEQSMIDKGLLQYMIKNPEKVLIIFDGYDEYGYRTEITGDFETKYPNDPRQKMPVPAMIAKIMKGKILKDSVVMISSRPEEAQELKKFPFDVKCEIHGFSPLQVQEYIQKYFKEDESMKKAVLDHIKENKILLSFGHIPVMCYLMCSYIKWYMTHSQTSENLPATRSELYYDVIKVFITRHSSSKYKEMTETEVEEILHKLSKFARSLTKKKKIIFTEEDMMKSCNFSEQEITNLKKSGLFDCCPAVKKSLSEKPPLEFSFSHLTIQEFLCAYRFVEKKQLPEKKKTSVVTWMFVAGIMARKKDEKLMKKLIKKVRPKNRDDDSNKVLTLHCLYEYRDDELSKRVINKLHDKYCNRYGWISFRGVNDLDCLAIRYFLYIVQLFTKKQTTKHVTSTQSFIVNTLDIDHSSLSPSGVSVLCESLSNYVPFVTRLWLCGCGLDDECVKIIAQTLKNTRITDLNLSGNRNITAKGIRGICAVLSDCSVETLNLSRCELDDECVKIIAQTLNKTTINYLSLGGNYNITAKGIRDICAVLSDCSVEGLNLSHCGLDDECVKIIAETLNKTTINNLSLMANNITDEGVMCVCDVVSKRDCPVEVLYLWGNRKITDKCKKSARKLLQLNKPNVWLWI